MSYFVYAAATKHRCGFGAFGAAGTWYARYADPDSNTTFERIPDYPPALAPGSYEGQTETAATQGPEGDVYVTYVWHFDSTPVAAPTPPPPAPISFVVAPATHPTASTVPISTQPPPPPSPAVSAPTSNPPARPVATAIDLAAIDRNYSTVQPWPFPVKTFQTIPYPDSYSDFPSYPRPSHAPLTIQAQASSSSLLVVGGLALAALLFLRR